MNRLIKTGSYKINRDGFIDDTVRETFINDILSKLVDNKIDLTEKIIRNITNAIISNLSREDPVIFFYFFLFKISLIK